MRYLSERRRFTPGARLLFYTDGLTEVFKGDEEFGPERLLDEFSSARRARPMISSMHCGRPSKDSLKAVRRETT
jgi:serine phosphatase RsbU (regulator of sigma subunit)